MKKISRRIGFFRFDRAIIALALTAAIALFARSWLADHPQHDPWAPLDLRDPPGWATAGKLQDLRAQPGQCEAVLERSAIAFETLGPIGEGECRRPSRITLASFPFTPSRPVTTCTVSAALALWIEQEVRPAAANLLGSPVTRIEHLGTYSCRRISGGGAWSEHATGNAIDIAAFVLEDGRRISLLEDWNSNQAEGRFLHQIRNDACNIFGTVLSPDYNAAHADHFHLDQASRTWGVCR